MNKQTSNQKYYKNKKNIYYLLIFIFLFIAIIVAFLNWCKVKSTEVTLDLIVDHLSFKLSESLNIFSIEAKTLGISHLNELVLSPAIKIEEHIPNGLENGQQIKWHTMKIQDSVRITPITDYWNVSLKSEYLNLSSLYIDSGSTVTFSVDEYKQNQYLLLVNNGNVIGTIETGDIFEIACNNCKIKNLQNANNITSRTLRVHTKNCEIEFNDLNELIQIVFSIPESYPKTIPYIIGKSIDIEEIKFTTLEGKEIGSTIVKDGSIYLAELDGKKINIKAGDLLVIKGLKNFQITRLILDDQIRVTLHGKVKKLESGTHRFLYSRMPSYLEWLHTNRSFTLYIATLLPILSGIFAVIFHLKNKSN